MNIPIKSNFVFTVKVLAEDSFLPQDLTGLTSATFTIMDKATSTVVGLPLTDVHSIDEKTYTNITTTIEVTNTETGALVSLNTSYTNVEDTYPIGTDGPDVTVDVGDPNTTTTTVSSVTTGGTTGILTITLTPTHTEYLIESLAKSEDGSYPKATYKASLILEITGRSDINVLIDSITAIKVK